MSTTSIPEGSPRSNPKMSVKPPVLASDILLEELAPRAPGRTLIRVLLGAFAVACGFSAAAARFGIGPHSTNVFEGSLLSAGIAAIGALVPLPYAARATVAVLAGLSLLVLGAVDRGPLSPLGQEGVVAAAAALVLVATLPAALFFRSQYRAFRAARFVLTAALVFALPAVVLAVLVVIDGQAPLPQRIADGLFAAATLTGLFGYMGEETSAGCSRFAALVLVTYSARVATRILPASFAGSAALVVVDDAYGQCGYLVSSAGTLAAATVVAVGFYQILATLFAESARDIDVHRTAVPSLPDGEKDLPDEDRPEAD